VPYASTSQTAAGHTLTATSASKGWNLPGLKCAQLIVSNNADRDAWNSLGPFPSHGASTMGVAANTAAFRDGEAWLAEVVAYLDESRQLLADLLAEELPDVRYRPPEGTYLAWLDCRAVAGTGSRAARVAERGRMLVIDGPACGLGGEGALRFNFATPQPVLAQMVRRMAAALRD
jgi:cystathionine beta-lyase